MMNIKYLLMVVLGVSLCISGSIPAFSFEESETMTTNIVTFTQSHLFSLPMIKENEEYVTLHCSGVDTVLRRPGEPLIPTLVETFEFPLGTHLVDIQCTVNGLTTYSIHSDVMWGQKPVPFYSSRGNYPKQIPSSTVYDSNKLYPLDWYAYKLTGGLNKNNMPTTFLTISSYPIRYSPSQQTITSIQSMTLDVTMQLPTQMSQLPDDYDLLIICYDRFASFLEPLVEHKTSHGLTTKLVTLSDIYDSVYFTLQGRDEPEQIKYFIQQSKETWGVTYVLLVGNFKKMPVRYTHLETDAGGSYEELEFVSDLYYADIYDNEGNFSSWDTDDDNVFGEWPYPESSSMEDQVDLVPDVHLGRLACMYGFEVKSVVNKIIDYENNAYGSSWYHRFILGGGDTFDKNWEGGTDYNEGEVACDKAVEYMTGFTPTRLYASFGNLSTANIHDAISAGCGFVYFVGHGNPRNWATHNNGDYLNWTEGVGNKDILQLSNKGMSPILMVGGCHNSEFDVTPMNMIKGILEEGFVRYFSANETWFGSYWRSNWVPECWSWVFVKTRRGGALASMGSVGYGGVNIGDYDANGVPDCVEGADGWFETQFFRLYNEEHVDVLGQTYSQVVTDYVHSFEVYSNRYDAKIVETHVLLGDPSLKIGGYE